jgi:hypothetical protein
VWGFLAVSGFLAVLWILCGAMGVHILLHDLGRSKRTVHFVDVLIVVAMFTFGVVSLLSYLYGRDVVGPKKRSK